MSIWQQSTRINCAATLWMFLGTANDTQLIAITNIFIYFKFISSLTKRLGKERDLFNKM